MRTVTCKMCQRDVLWLTDFAGRRRAFSPAELTSPDVPAAARWYFSASRGAVPGSMVDRDPSVPFLTLHDCRGTRSGDDVPLDDAGREQGLISDHHGPRPPDVKLTPAFRFGYRWPSSWVHIVEVDRGLCGAVVMKSLTAAEERRMQQMPVCPECLLRYRRRRA